jgi:serine/threonine protein kinase
MAEPAMIGPYTLIKELGCGGMAQIYLARRIFPDGRRMACALKLPRKQAALNPALLRQFEQEGELSMQVQHDNIVHVFDCGHHDGLPYLVMEYVAGCNLLELILRAVSVGQPWDVNTAVHIVREVGYALVHAHELTTDGLAQRVVHRDVASKNIMINLSGGVLLADFGVATSAAIRTTHNHIKGTLAYMAPEHYLGHACPASDAFGLGAILWELLEGQPFRSDIPEKDMAQAVVDGRVAPLTREVPPVVRKVAKGLLQPDVLCRMRLVDMLVEFEDFPSRRMHLQRMMTHLSGGGVQASGLSGAHLAPSLELVQTLAAVKAAGISPSELRRPSLDERRGVKVPSDFVREVAPKTIDVEPPSLDAAVDDAVDGTGVPAPATIVMGQPPEQPRDRGRVHTARLERGEPPWVRDRVVVTERMPAPWAGRPDVERTDVHVAGAATSAPRTRTPRPRWWIGAVASIVGLLGAMLGLAMVQRSPKVELRADPATVEAALEPEPVRGAAVPEQTEPLEPEPVQAAAVPEPLEPPVPEPHVPEPMPAVAVPEETKPPEPAPSPEPAVQEQKRPAKPKVKPPSVRVVIKRGFVDHAEIKIAGKARLVPSRGAVEIEVPAGRQKVRWRTQVDDAWQSTTFDFEPRIVHTCLISSSGPRIAKEGQR